MSTPSRVIRTSPACGPIAAGFVVRAEALGDKRLVHNYGHGGAGITLSWGSSKLATELGLQGHSGPVAVIGAGVMGLSTARLVQEAGFAVTLYAKALPPDTTSNIAGGQFHPFAISRQRASRRIMAQFTRALDYSWRRFQIMVGDDYGIRWLPTYVEADSPEAKLLDSFPPINRMLARDEHPFPVASTLRYDTIYVEVGRYLRQMIRDVQIAGGRIEVRNFATPADIAALPEIARLQLHRPRQPGVVRRPGPASGPRPARHPRAAARDPLCLHRRPRLHVPARRRHPARRHVRASTNGTRRRSPRRSPASSPDHQRFFAALPLHRLKCPSRLPTFMAT